MHKLVLAVTLALFLSTPGPLFAEGERAGDFDYYLLSLGWSPSWCATTGDARGDDQCSPSHNYAFTLHGLWPQYETGWSSDCWSAARAPTRVETAGMADIMGSSGLAWHEWKKHGRCSGLPAADFFALARRAYGRVTIPPLFAQLSQDIRLPASVVEDAFLDANPGLERNMITVTCDQGRIAEVRLCVTPDLVPRPCGADVMRDCKMKDALMEKVR